jgi:hypothetical protein
MPDDGRRVSSHGTAEVPTPTEVLQGRSVDTVERSEMLVKDQVAIMGGQIL